MGNGPKEKNQIGGDFDNFLSSYFPGNINTNLKQETMKKSKKKIKND